MYDPKRGEIKPGSKMMMPPLKPLEQSQQPQQSQQNPQPQTQMTKSFQQSQQIKEPPQKPINPNKLYPFEKRKVRILEPIIILLLLSAGIFVLFGGLSYFESFPKEKASKIFLSIEEQSNELNAQSSVSLAIDYVLNESNKIMIKDNNFFASKLDSIEDGFGSSEKTYGLVRADGIMTLTMAISIIYLTSYIDDSPPNESKEELIIRFDSNSSIQNEINQVKERIKSRPSKLDFSKFYDENKEMDGMSPNFINRSKQHTYDYTNQYIDYKVNEFNTNLDSNNIIALMINAKQIHTIYTVFGDWPMSFE